MKKIISSQVPLALLVFLAQLVRCFHPFNELEFSP